MSKSSTFGSPVAGRLKTTACALASMSPAVLDYRNLAPVLPQLLDRLAARAEAAA